MVREIAEDVWQLHELFVCSYLLRGPDNGLCLIDAGFVREPALLRRALRLLGRDFADIRHILLTHGHLDHTFNLAWLRQRCPDARILIAEADLPHLRGVYPYRGKNRICGALEAAGRAVLRYRPTEVDGLLEPGETLDAGGGLRVIPLPGHTVGHCGFFRPRDRLLFCGDLCANTALGTGHTPAFFNSCPERFGESYRAVFALDPAGLLANHCDRAGPALQWERFQGAFQISRYSFHDASVTHRR